MAPKGVVNAKPAVLKTERMRLQEISVEEDSGWRDLCEERAEELYISFKGGEYGIGILTIPSILCVGNVPKMSVHDGKACISNGKATVVALKRLFEECQKETKGEGEEACPPPWAAGELYDIFEQGLRCDFVQFSTDDRELVLAWYGLAHDVDSNKYRQTSIEVKIRIVENARARAPGGTYTAAVKTLLEIYGVSKKGTIYRWINTAKNLDEAVLAHIKGRPNLQQSFIMDNKYLCGYGGRCQV